MLRKCHTKSIQHHNPNRYRVLTQKFSNIYLLLVCFTLKWLNVQCVFCWIFYKNFSFYFSFHRFDKINFMEGFTSRRIHTVHLLYDKINLLWWFGLNVWVWNIELNSMVNKRSIFTGIYCRYIERTYIILRLSTKIEMKNRIDLPI